MKRYRSQVMKAPLWLVAITLAAWLAGLRLCPKPYLLYCFIITVILVTASFLFFMAIYTYWAVKDPDRLGWSVELLRSQNSTRED